MQSIRPLVTITILVVVGAYLYVKINQGPATPAGADEAWQSAAPEGVPPLYPDAATSNGNASTPLLPTVAPIDGNSAPVGLAAPAASDASMATAALPGTLPPVPAMPDLPSPSTTPNTGAPAVTSVPLPTDLPQEIPMARYPGDPAPIVVDTTGQSLGGLTPVSQSVQDQAVQQAGTIPMQQTTPNLSIPQSPLSQNPLRQFTPATTDVSPDPRTSLPEAHSLAGSWPAIGLSLERRDLARALELLSPWHDDPSLSPAEAEHVETLLGQLAGTVVYSTEHQLEPARVVKPGETLDTIAKEYNVPWQLLAKINGIAGADAVRPGQELKVIRGPFGAIVDLNRKQLTLLVGNRYAGKFPVRLSTAVPVTEGQWVVVGFTEAPRAVALNRADATQPTPPKEGVFLGPTTLENFAVPLVGLSEADTNEVSDILSIGSRVIIRR